MCLLSIVLWYVLLLVTSSDSLGNSTNSIEQRDNLTEFFVNSIRDHDDEIELHNLFENSKNDDEIQYESQISSNRKNSTRYKYHIMKLLNENYQMFMESYVNFTKINYENNSMLQASNENLTKLDRENNFMSYKLDRNFNTDDYNNTIVTIISYEKCDNETCIQLCCPFGDRLTSEKKCVTGQDNYSFPDVYQNDSETKFKKLDELFFLTVRDPCVLQGSAHRTLTPDEYLFLANGSLYQDPNEIISSTSYCLGILDRNIYDVIVCMNQIVLPTYISICLLVSLPFLLLTFVVYSILPEVQNIHSYTLRVYVASLFITNVVILFVQEIPTLSEWKYCIPLAYVFYISLLSSCFWLNVTCFDIWWTFKKLDLHRIDRQKKKRKFMKYSIYAWGITFILTVTCVIMDHVPGIPKDLIRPEMCKKKFWFSRNDALAVYYYGPTGTAFLSNICLFIVTGLKILYHNKHTTHQLRTLESRRYDKKKRKFITYLKLFIVMGICKSMRILLWLISACDSIPQIVWNIYYTINILQGLIIFIVYVCKKKILRLLLKRFGWKDRVVFGILLSTSNYNYSTRNSSNMSYVSSISESISMQKINPSIKQTNHHVDPNVT